MATSRVPVPPPEEEPFEEEQQPLPASTEPQTAVDRLVMATPWWGISVGFHVVIALAGVLLFGGGRGEANDQDAISVAPPKKPRPLPEMEKPRDLDPNKKVLDTEKSVEDPMFRKVEEATHNESDDDEEHHQMKGDSLDFVSDKPFKGKGISDAIGVGGGGGGRFGGRLGGKKNLVARGGGGGDTENAVTMALRWLSRHQNEDGSWSVAVYTNHCNKIAKYATGGKCTPNPCPEQNAEGFSSGVTGLAILAFLGAGYSHTSKDTYDGICFGDVVRKGIQWMMSHQDQDGCIGSRKDDKYMYNHSICALALSEAYGLTGSNLFKEQAQKGVDFLIAAQNQDNQGNFKGWRYSYKCGDNDSSVTGWCVMVLKSAEISGLTFPRSGYEGTRSWYDEVTEDQYYRVGYTYKGSGKVYVPKMNESFNHHEALTAIAMMARIFMDKNKGDAKLAGGAALLVRDLPKWDGNDIDFYYWYYASLALFQYDGPSGNFWGQWNKAMKDCLVKNQNVAASGCKNGSWEPVDRWSCEGGRVYGVAINALTLEVYYRYANVFGGASK